MKRKNFYINFTSVALVIMTITIIVSCATTKQVNFVKKGSNATILGTIVVREGTLKNNVETKGIPQIQTKLRVSLLEKGFTKTTLARYNKSLITEETTVIDSLGSTTYFEIEVIDDIGFAALLNEDLTTREYIKNSKNAGAITKIKVVPSTSIQKKGIESYYLEFLENDSYGIGFYKDGKRVSLIPFSDLNVFDYEVSYFCFGKNERNQIVIMDLVEEGKRCKRPLVKKAKKLTTFKKLTEY